MKGIPSRTARTRRVKENAELMELARLLPLSPAITGQLDKAAIIRLTTAYLRLREAFPGGLGDAWGLQPATSSVVEDLGYHLLQTLGGFVTVLASDGKILYISETASVHLGLSQVELIGASVYDYVHPEDSDQMIAVLARPHRCTLHDTEKKVSVVIRMKCVLAKRNAGLTTGGYKVVHCTGYLKLRRSTKDTPSSDDGDHPGLGVVVVVGHCLPVCSPATDMKVSSDMFMSRASLDLQMVYVDDGVERLTGLQPQDLMERSLYHYIHPSDVPHMRRAHNILLTKGQATTRYYRLLTKGGGWVWVYSHIINTANRPSRHHSVVCVNHVLSKVTNKEHHIQLDQTTSLQRVPSHLDVSQQSQPSSKRRPKAGRARSKPRRTPYPNPAAAGESPDVIHDGSLPESKMTSPTTDVTERGGRCDVVKVREEEEEEERRENGTGCPSLLVNPYPGYVLNRNSSFVYPRHSLHNPVVHPPPLCWSRSGVLRTVNF